MSRRELPPTAGLPLGWRDFLPAAPAVSLEEALARRLGLPSVRIECSGTAALVVTLETLKRRSPRRSVVVPAYTCPLVPMAVERAGLRVRLCDVAKGSFELDPEALEAACDDDALCILPTHLGGAVADLEPVLGAGRRSGAFVVEDAAQSLGATWRGHPVGTIGDAGFFSLAVGKGLTLYEGGVLVAQGERLRAELDETSRRTIAWDLRMEALRIAQLAGYALTYRPGLLGLVYGRPLRAGLDRGDVAEAIGDVPDGIPLHRVSAFRRRIGARAWSRLEPWLRESTARGEALAARVDAIHGCRVVRSAVGGSGTWPFVMVLLESASARDRALDRLWREGLGVTRLFAHDLTGYEFLAPFVPRTDVPNARDFAVRLLTIGTSPWTTEADVRRVTAELESAVRARS